MDDLEQMLDDCLRQISEDGASLDDCLSRHPGHASELGPLLQAAARMRSAGSLTPRAAFKHESRARLMSRVREHPPRRPLALSPAWRMVASLATLIIVLILTTTAFAQNALPGDALYAWKLSSEEVWRTLAPDRVTVDLNLVSRRTDELTDVAHDPSREAEATNGLHAVLSRLKSEDNPGNGPRIEKALKAHQKRLSDRGIHDKELDAAVHGKP